MSLSAHLIELGQPLLDEQLRHPTVAGIRSGTLPEPVFRAWLEQDYLFLLDYVRVFSKLAWQAPDNHLGMLVDLAHATWHDELDLHREMAAEFSADLGGARKNRACSAYTAFLLDAAGNYAEGLSALLPCMWGYSALGQRLAADVPASSRYARWVQTYAAPEFAALAAACATMLDEAAASRGLSRARAADLFRAGMDHELAFWDVAVRP